MPRRSPRGECGLKSAASFLHKKTAGSRSPRGERGSKYHKDSLRVYFLSSLPCIKLPPEKSFIKQTEKP